LLGLRRATPTKIRLVRDGPPGVYETGGTYFVLGIAEELQGALLNRSDGTLAPVASNERHLFAHFCMDGTILPTPNTAPKLRVASLESLVLRSNEPPFLGVTLAAHIAREPAQRMKTGQSARRYSYIAVWTSDDAHRSTALAEGKQVKYLSPGSRLRRNGMCASIGSTGSNPWNITSVQFATCGTS